MGVKIFIEDNLTSQDMDSMISEADSFLDLENIFDVSD